MKAIRLLLSLLFVLGSLIIFVSVAKAVAVTFTGNVEADFPAFTLYDDRGGVGDVGVPGLAPPGTAVGWDLENVGIAYDNVTDSLYVGLNMGNGAISGDADGDGNPGQTATWLDDLQGTDLANLAGTEAIDILIDVDQSCELGSGQGTDFEFVAGIPNNGSITAFAVSPFSQDPNDFTNPGAGHVTPTTLSGAVFASPSASQPDLEFQINNFCSTLLPACVPGVTPINFAFRVRAGSGADDGIGEDAIACTDISYTPTAVTLKNVETRVEAPLVSWVALGLLLMVLGTFITMKTVKEISE